MNSTRMSLFVILCPATFILPANGNILFQDKTREMNRRRHVKHLMMTSDVTSLRNTTSCEQSQSDNTITIVKVFCTKARVIYIIIIPSWETKIILCFCRKLHYRLLYFTHLYYWGRQPKCFLFFLEFFG